jgi:hypothetical protein
MTKTKIDNLYLWICEQIEEIEKDELFSNPPALIYINAPLDLLKEVDLKARYRILIKIQRAFKKGGYER